VPLWEAPDFQKTEKDRESRPIGHFFTASEVTENTEILYRARYKISVFSVTSVVVSMLIGPAFIGFLAQGTSLSFALTGVAFLLTIVGVCGRVVESQPSTAAEG
jgi:predicted PurR-regulated permease PerM